MDTQNTEDQIFSNQDVPFLYDSFVAEVDELISLSHFGPGLIVMIGASGMGKSTRLEQFEAEITDLGVVRIDGTPKLNLEQLYASILQQLQALDRTIEFENARQAIIEAAADIEQIILVDDAQQLSFAVLESLIRLVSPVSAVPEYPIRLLLSGEEDLISQVMEMSLVSSEAMTVINLTGLEKDEVASFLGHQLNLSKQSVEDNYGGKRLQTLWKLSAGNPGNLLKCLHQTEEVMPQTEKKATSTFFRSLLVLLGIMLLLLAVFGGDWLSTDRTTTPKSTQELIINKVTPTKTTATDNPQKKNQPAITRNESSSDKIEVLERATPPPQNIPASELESPSSLEQNPTGSLNQKPVELEPEEQANPDSSSQVSQETTDFVAPDPKLKSERFTEKNPLATKAITNSQNNATVSVPTKASSDKSLFTPDESWLLEQNPGRYMLQFVGLSSRQSMTQFLSQYSFAPSAKVYRSRLHNKPWFIVVEGLYKDADDARKARDNLAADRIKLKPWIKSLKVIQHEVRQAAKFR